MSDPIISAPRVQPPTGPQVTPQFNYSGSSYAPRADTISSMKTFVQKNSGWIILGTLVLGLLYTLWSFITLKPLPSDDFDRPDRRARGGSHSGGVGGIGGTAFRGSGGVSCRFEKPPGEEVIIGKSKLATNEFILPYQMLCGILTKHDNLNMALSATRGMMNQLGSSESFALRIISDGNLPLDRIVAFQKFIHEFIDTYKTELSESKVVGVPLPEEYYTLTPETGEYPIVTAFAKLFE